MLQEKTLPWAWLEFVLVGGLLGCAGLPTLITVAAQLKTFQLGEFFWGGNADGSPGRGGDNASVCRKDEEIIFDGGALVKRLNWVSCGWDGMEGGRGAAGARVSKFYILNFRW